ncbi:hypothetical protein [Nocardioides sp. LHG3406-4]|uniref:hypothetical protein n=1 Tax=Nocardioides sp. LHG3406-4 TaxID=2804575 RepID=UPI003CF26B3C
MGKDKRKNRVSRDDGTQVAKLPKKKCCVSKPRCNRCPLRMLKEGTLPEGYTVKRRKLVTVDQTGAKKKSKKIAA